jgi:molybdopterin-binding protein
VLDQPEDGAEEAMILRVVHLGFQVRVEVVRGNGDELTVLVTAAEADALELESGAIVWVRRLAGVSV